MLPFPLLLLFVADAITGFGGTPASEAGDDLKMGAVSRVVARSTVVFLSVQRKGK